MRYKNTFVHFNSKNIYRKSLYIYLYITSSKISQISFKDNYNSYKNEIISIVFCHIKCNKLIFHFISFMKTMKNKQKTRGIFM